ncbi:MAG TPA: DNA primase, partial [Actinomycetota bacterium]|nr:DNA primase [Actinomycetota bacterium]
MAKIKDEDIDLLRERADIVEIVSAYTHLKRSGGHSFKGLCPFHSEKTPSFTVDTSSGLFFCFGCQKGGNVYQFVQEQENLPFPEAVEWVARKSGFELHYEESSPGEQRARGVKARIIEANRLAAEFFHETLVTSPDADTARRYLDGRGFGREVAARWQLGYAPGRDSLYKYLRGKGFTADELLQADLIKKSERDGSLYDSFRQRITFPTWNLQGDVVAFGARALGDQQPKYLNTSETPVFSKSRLMFGLDRAKSAIARGSAVVVEGYTDVIALHEAGVTEAVATNGVALGESHFELLRKFTDRIVLMFDPDEAGQGAIERGFDLAQKLGVKLGLDVLLAPPPPGRDPADVVREDGRDAIDKVVGAAQPLWDFKIDRELDRAPLDTAEAQARAFRRVAELLRSHPDPIARHQHAMRAARRIGLDENAAQRVLSETRGSTHGGGAAGGRTEKRVPGHVKVEREALSLLLKHGAAAARWAQEINEDAFTAAPRRELFRAALETATSELSISRVASSLSPEAHSLLSELSVEESTSPPTDDEIKEVFMRLKVFRLERDIKARRTTLQEVNPVQDSVRHDALFT